MKNLLTVLGIGGLGWFLWEGMTAAMWWEIGKWVGTGLVSLIILYVIIWNIKNRAEQRSWENEEKRISKMRPKQSPMHPQMLYIPQQPAYPQQAPQTPVGLVDLPLDKYEWEV
jgi:hypothetical protein